MKVVLYTNHCPRCLYVERLLQVKNIKYEKVNDVDIMIKMGLETTPVLQIDDLIMEYEQAEAWINKR